LKSARCIAWTVSRICCTCSPISFLLVDKSKPRGPVDSLHLQPNGGGTTRSQVVDQ